MQSAKGNLYLIPSLLGGDEINIIPKIVIDRINQIDTYIVENERNSRRYLIKLGIKTAIDDLTFHVLDKHKPHEGIQRFLNSADSGKDIGLISDAGCPAVADPGSLVVSEAHHRGINIMPLVGPSSLLLALMASGFNGQQFSFHGYLPIEKADRNKKIKFIENLLKKEGSSHIFIETPYRNEKLMSDLTQICYSKTKLCVATDVSLPTQSILTKTISNWAKSLPKIHKRPTVFILGQ